MKHLTAAVLLVLFFLACTKKDVISSATTKTPILDSPKQVNDSLLNLVADGVPSSLSIYSGDGQMASRGTTLTSPLVVKLKNKEGLPLKGMNISFTPGAGSGQVSAANTTTDVNGLASTNWTLGANADSTQTLTAIATYNNSSWTVVFHATGIIDTFYRFTGTVTLDSNSPDTGTTYSGASGSITFPADFPVYNFDIAYPLEFDSIKIIRSPYTLQTYMLSLSANSFRFAGSEGNTDGKYMISGSITRIIPATGRQKIYYVLRWDFEGYSTDNIMMTGVAHLTSSKRIDNAIVYTSYRTGSFSVVKQ